MRRAALAVFTCCLALLAADTFTQRQREFWSFQKVKDQTPPAVRDTRLGANADRSLHPGEAGDQGLTPGPPADKATLLRRATFDLTGLPPTPEEVEAFLADKSPAGFREGGGPPARLAAIRRALGTPLAGSGALRRKRRLQGRRDRVRMRGGIAIT